VSKGRGEGKDRSEEKTEEISSPRKEKREQIIQPKMCCTIKEVEKGSIQLKEVLYNQEGEKPERVGTMVRQKKQRDSHLFLKVPSSQLLLSLLTFHLILDELFHVLKPHVSRSQLQDHGIMPLWRTRDLSSR
jgi:hypothetical protein